MNLIFHGESKIAVATSTVAQKKAYGWENNTQ